MFIRLSPASGLLVAGLLLVSALPVIALATAYLNADTVLASVMSLQNVTLYYWGQNRLLNILPFATSWVTHPTSNFLLILYLASLASFGLLLLLAMYARRAVGAGTDLLLPVFAGLAATYLLAFSPGAIYLMSLAHTEYALSLLLAGSAAYLVWFAPIHGAARLVLATPLVVLALGLNPSIVIPLGLALIAANLYRRRVAGPDAALLGVAVVAFAGWGYVSSLHGPATAYADFSFAGLGDHLVSVAERLGSAVRPVALAAFVLGFALVFAMRRWRSDEGRLRATSAPGFALVALCLFCIGWIVLFSASGWVKRNEFETRYFIPSTFALLAVAAIAWAALLRDVTPRLRGAVVLPVLAVAVLLTADRVRPVDGYAVFQQVDALPRSDSGLYAGDYWRVWPTVYRDLAAGRVAYGLTFRGEGNRRTARRHVRAVQAEDGTFTVLCIGDPVESCAAQVSYILGPTAVIDSEAVAPEAILVTMTRLQAAGITRATNPG